jgi:hypothetical protein
MQKAGGGGVGACACKSARVVRSNPRPDLAFRPLWSQWLQQDFVRLAEGPARENLTLVDGPRLDGTSVSTDVFVLTAIRCRLLCNALDWYGDRRIPGGATHFRRGPESDFCG